MALGAKLIPPTDIWVRRTMINIGMEIKKITRVKKRNA